MFNHSGSGMFVGGNVLLLAALLPCGASAGDLDIDVDCPDSVSVSGDIRLVVSVDVVNETDQPVVASKQLAVSLAGSKSSEPVIYGPFVRKISLDLEPFGSQNFEVLVTKLEAQLQNKLAVVGVGIKEGDDIEAPDHCVLKIRP